MQICFGTVWFLHVLGHVVQQPRMFSILEAGAGHVAHVRLAGCQPAGGAETNLSRSVFGVL